MKDRYRKHTCGDVSIWKSEEIVSEEPGGVIEIALEKHLLTSDLVVRGAKLFLHTI